MLIFIFALLISLTNSGTTPQTTTTEQSVWDLVDGPNDTSSSDTMPSNRLANELPNHYLLHNFLMANYNPKLPPKTMKDELIRVALSIELYQIIGINEPRQYLEINAWISERWMDHLLVWDPQNFGNATMILLPYSDVWRPDTTLYNSLEMDDAASRRLHYVRLQSSREAGLVQMLYPAIFKFSCLLDLRFFPFDTQQCEMTFGSWAHDNKEIDYVPFGEKDEAIGYGHMIENEEWIMLGSQARREEVKFQCCSNNYTLIIYTLHLQRKPLFYLINLILPTSLITLIAIVGFFSAPTVNDIREEKISLGITTLLSMSILILMVSDKMPSSSSFIPLIGWFYLSMITLISSGTLIASLIIYTQKKGALGKRPEENWMQFYKWLGTLTRFEMPIAMKRMYRAKIKNLARRPKRSRWQLFANKPEPVSKSRQAVRRGNKLKPKSPVLFSESTTPDRAPIPINIDGEEMTLLDINDTILSFTPMFESLDVPDSPYSKVSKDSQDLRRRVTGRRKVGMMRTGTTARKTRFSEKKSDSNEKNVAKVAEIEYDWIAAVVERCSFIVYLILFVFMSFGINGIGLLYWSSVGSQITT